MIWLAYALLVAALTAGLWRWVRHGSWVDREPVWTVDDRGNRWR